jgi:hypothetical protein
MPAGVQGVRAGAACLKTAHVDGMKAVHILGGIDGVEEALGVDLGGQGQLDEDAVDLVAGVEGGDQIEHGFSGDVFGRGDEVAEDAELGAGLDLVADVNLRGGDVADKHRGEPGPDALAARARTSSATSCLMAAAMAAPSRILGIQYSKDSSYRFPPGTGVGGMYERLPEGRPASNLRWVVRCSSHRHVIYLTYTHDMGPVRSDHVKSVPDHIKQG